VIGSSAALKMQAAMAEVGSLPMLALLVAFPHPQGLPGVPVLPFDGAAVVNSPHIQWIAVDSSKPVSCLNLLCT
jgi:predicted NAD/FAD-dependent oxidoreductase